MHDLLVIGSGSAGAAAAIEASEQGAKVAVIEAGTIGGTCVNIGCVPSKTMLRAAEANLRANASSFRGVRPKGSEVDFGEIARQKAGLVDEMRQHRYVDVLESYGVALLRGRARFTGRGGLEVDGEPFQARKFLIATGAAPALPPIPGLSQSEPWSYIEALSAEEQPESLVVIGGGAVGLELAQAYARLGTRVTVLEALPRILSQEEEQVSGELERYLKDEGIEIQTQAAVSRVDRGDRYRVTALVGAEEQAFEAERLLGATGRKTNSGDLNLEAAGVGVSPDGAVAVDENMFTSNENILAAGDVAGLPQVVYVAALSGRVAARNALVGPKEPIDLTALPRVTFTDPAVAAVGMTEAEASEMHVGVRASVLAMNQVPRARAAFDSRGFIKLVIDGEGTVLGMHVLAPEAGEVIQEGILAVKLRLNYRDLSDLFHPYLTAVEGVRLAAQAFDTKVEKLSCCA